MTLLAVMAGIVLTLALLLSIPLDIEFRLARGGNEPSRVGVRWLFGALDRDVRSFRRKGKKRREKKKRRGKGTIKPLIAMVGSRGFVGRCTRFVRGLFGKVDLREFHLRGKVGLDDPADTGYLFAALSSALHCLGSFSPFDFQVEPDFSGGHLRGSCTGKVRLFPIQIMGSFLLFAFSPQTLRAVKAAIRERRR